MTAFLYILQYNFKWPVFACSEIQKWLDVFKQFALTSWINASANPKIPPDLIREKFYPRNRLLAIKEGRGGGGCRIGVRGYAEDEYSWGIWLGLDFICWYGISSSNCFRWDYYFRAVYRVCRIYVNNIIFLFKITRCWY